MDVESYLHRIRYNGSLTPNAETLRALHVAHLYSVPFENFDIHFNRPIHLDTNLFSKKIVEQNRGGFCYELNGLFAHLLRELGFDVTLLSARVASDGKLGPEFDHLCLLVQLEQRWLADVGFGESFVEPLLLDWEKEQTQRGVAYRISHDGEAWTLWRTKASEGEAREYVFTLKPRALPEFSAMCHYQQTSPQSHFTTKRICSRATPDGRISLTEHKLIITSNGERQERELSEEEYARTLVEQFGMNVPDNR
jgi:N-hydroxyarylamine O-acetyltransferase